MIRTVRARLTGGLLAAALVVTVPACGGGGKAGGAPAASPASSTPAATAGTGSPAPSGAASAPSAAEQQVRENWEKFFSPGTPTSQKAGLLENGDQLQPLLLAFSGDQRVGHVEAEVSKVDLTSAGEATVTYSLTLDGATAVPGATGTAVLQDGVWKVSVKSLCALIALDSSGAKVPGC
jgi:hypothetical protein